VTQGPIVHEVIALAGGGAVVVDERSMRRFSATSAMDPSFGDDGTVPAESGERLQTGVVLPDGRLVIASDRTPAGSSAGAYESLVRVYGVDGELDTTVGAGGTLVLPIETRTEDVVVVHGAAVDRDGNVVIVGVEGSAHPRAWIARILAGS